MRNAKVLEREPLRGLEGVCVVIEDIPGDVEQMSFVKRQLKTEVGLRLRRARIQALTEEAIDRPGSSYLYVNVNAIGTDVGLYAYASRVALKQKVFLCREPFIEVFATTWEIGGVGTVGINKLKDIVQSVCGHIDKFIHDYLAVNSRRAGKNLPPSISAPSSLASLM
jgi:hypothetical protein